MAAMTNSTVKTKLGNVRLFVLAPVILLAGLGTTAFPFGGNTPLLNTILNTSRTVGTLTVTAKNDGTFEIVEIPDYWFGPTAVGGALDFAMQRRFGKDVKESQVNVIVQADSAASGDAIRQAIASARSRGFNRFGFMDRRVSDQVRQDAAPAAHKH